jgi:hypothetical protein
MKPFTVAAAGLGAFLSAVRAQQNVAPTINVVRDPGCGCCLGWVAHLRGIQGTKSNQPIA